MKKVIFTINLFLFIILGAQAQDAANVDERIANVLAQFPAEDSAELNSAMKEIEEFDEEKLYQLSKQISTEDKVDDSEAEYALMGYTAYVSKSGKETKRNEAEKAWLKALSETDDKVKASFLMSLLEIIGSNESVATLKSFLTDEDLSFKAAPTLASIGTSEAGEVLIEALKIKNDTPKEPILQALGDMKLETAVDEVTKYATQASDLEKKAALYALVNIGHPSSNDVLIKETQKEGEDFEDKKGTTSYEEYLGNLFKNGHEQEAGAFVEEFVKNTKNSPVLSRIAALKALASIKKEKSLETLAKAAYNENIEYRHAALKFAEPYINDSNTSLFTKNLKKADPEVQVSLIDFLKDYKLDKKTLKTVSKFAQKSKDSDLKQASVLALSNVKKATQQLFKILEKADKEDKPAIKKALLLNKSETLEEEIIEKLPKYSGFQKEILLEVLGERKTKSAFEVVAKEIENDDPEIKKTALKVLPEVADENSIDEQIELLESMTSEEAIEALQKSIVNSIKSSTSETAEQKVLNSFKDISEEKQHLLFPALSVVGNDEALNVVYERYEKNDDQSEEAFEALTSWTEENALDPLLSIATNEKSDDKRKERALDAYIKLVGDIDASDEQKLSYYKKAMAAKPNKDQKAAVLNQTNELISFSALSFAAEYLDDADLKQTAANTVMEIALSDETLYNEEVHDWLLQAKDLLEGPDAEYEKKSIDKFLEENQ